MFDGHVHTFAEVLHQELVIGAARPVIHTLAIGLHFEREAPVSFAKESRDAYHLVSCPVAVTAKWKYESALSVW